MGGTVSGMHRGMRRLTDAPTWAILGGLVALSTILRAVAGLEISTPLIGPDEQTYAELGRSLYEHGRFEIWDQTNRFYTLTYPLLVGLALSNGDIEIGYAALKVLQALVMSLTAVPVYLWGRTFLSRGWALAAAALTLAVPGLAYSGLVMTEVLFLPVATLTAWACARALERPTVGRQAAAAALILVACATRLQAVVFVPVIVTAVLAKALLDRRPRDVLRFWPAATALAAAAVAWGIHRLGSGGPASELLGAYRSAGDVTYSLADILRFVAWHFADAVLFTGVASMVALVLLLPRWRELGDATRAFLAITAASVVWFVVQVGIFASRNVEHIAERDLLALVPLLLLALCAWIYNGAPRPRRTAVAVAVVVLAAFLYLPVQRFVTHAEFADAFSLIPLVRLRERTSGLFVDVVLMVGVTALLAAALLLPRRLLKAVPATIGILAVAASLSSSRALASDARLLRDATTGPTRTWVSDVVDRPVTFLYTSDLYTVGPWSLRFWNPDVRSVVKLDDVYLPGPVPSPLAGTGGDGRLVVEGVPVDAEYVVASSSIAPVGEALSQSGPMTLWHVEQPFRLAQRTYGLGYDGTVAGTVRVTAYSCSGGALSFSLVSNDEQTIELLQNGILVDSRALKPLERWEGSVAALPQEAGTCDLALRAPGSFDAERFELQR
jgi:hypothetical protein